MIEVHYGSININNQLAYVVTFLKDKKQATMLFNRLPSGREVIARVIKSKLLSEGDSINEVAELSYVNKNPLPANYIDVDSLIEY